LGTWLPVPAQALRPTVALEEDFEQAELIGEQTFIAARPTTPKTPVDPALVPTENRGRGKALAHFEQQAVGLGGKTALIRGIDEVARREWEQLPF